MSHILHNLFSGHHLSQLWSSSSSPLSTVQLPLPSFGHFYYYYHRHHCHPHYHRHRSLLPSSITNSSTPVPITITSSSSSSSSPPPPLFSQSTMEPDISDTFKQKDLFISDPLILSSPPPSSSELSPPPTPSLFVHYLQQSIDTMIQNMSTYNSVPLSTGEPFISASQQQMFRQDQLLMPSLEQIGTISTTTTISSVMAVNGSGVGQPNTGQFDQSVFSLLTMRNALIITFYSLIILVSLTGNLLVCRVAFGTRDMRTTTNLLIASLACSDIVMTVFNIPFNVVRMLPISWPFGSVVCILVPLIQTSCVYVSTFTMTLIALHRLWTVRQRRTSIGKASGGKVALTVLAIWMVALTLSLPHAAFNRVRSKLFQGRVLTRCMVQHPRVNFNFPLLLTVEVLITQYLLPLSITLVVYVKIARVIARQGALICKLSDERKRRQSEAKRRRIIMLALAVATFATCWAPINLYLFLVDSRLVHLQTHVFIMCHWFAMSSVCYNPIIYCWLNEKFRNGAKQSLRTIMNIVSLGAAARTGSNEKQQNSI